jgi:uncharacterized membrane protein YraQ (UPF0718 family)
MATALNILVLSLVAVIFLSILITLNLAQYFWNTSISYQNFKNFFKDNYLLIVSYIVLALISGITIGLVYTLTRQPMPLGLDPIFKAIRHLYTPNVDFTPSDLEVLDQSLGSLEDYLPASSSDYIQTFKDGTYKEDVIQSLTNSERQFPDTVENAIKYEKENIKSVIKGLYHGYIKEYLSVIPLIPKDIYPIMTLYAPIESSPDLLQLETLAGQEQLPSVPLGTPRLLSN